MRTTYPENLSHWAAKDHEIRPPRFFRLFEWSKKFFCKNFCFLLRIVQFVWKTCFHDFGFFFLSKCPRLCHFSTKKRNFRSRSFYRVSFRDMTWYCILWKIWTPEVKMSRIQDFQIRLFYEFMFLQVRKDEKCQKSILISSRLSSTEVEPVGFRRYSSQLQLSIEPFCL